MRILVLAPEAFYVERGTPIAVYTLLETLSGAGHSCEAVVYSEGRAAELAGVRVRRPPRLPGLGSVPPGLSVRKLAADAAMFPIVAWRLVFGRFDLVIAVEEAVFMALALKPLARVPYIYDIDSSLPESIADKYAVPRWLWRVMRYCERRALRSSAGAIACCEALAELVREQAPALPVQTLEDTPLIAPAEDGDRNAAPAGASDDAAAGNPVVMYIGNLEFYQGVDLLLKGMALASATPARLVIIGGDAVGIARHRALAERLGIAHRVVFEGPRPLSELGVHMRRATVLASPRRAGRNTPMKIYSYLASGTPVLATRLATHTQVLDDDIACLVEPTPESMGAGLAELLGDADARTGIARRARVRVARDFSLEAYREKLVGFLERDIRPQLGRRGVKATAAKS